jgi:hypothetical protein
MFKNWGGSRPGSGRPSKYGLDANRSIGLAIEVTEAMRARQEAERDFKYENDPRTSLIRDQRRRIEHHASRHVERRMALPYLAPHSKAIDSLGRLWGCTVGSYKAEAIREVGERHNLPVRVVRDCYCEFRKRIPEPERAYTVFDVWWWQRPVAKLREVAERLYREKLLRWMLRDHDDLPSEPPNPDLARSIAKDEIANRHRKRKR